MIIKVDGRMFRKILIGLVVLFVLFFVLKKFSTKSPYVVTGPTAPTDATFTNYQSTVTACRGAYLNALNIAGGNTSDPAVRAAEAVRDACYASQANTYVGARCTYVNQANIPTTTGTVVNNVDVKTAYDGMGADITKIQTVYQPILDLINTQANKTYTYPAAVTVGTVTIPAGTTVTEADVIAARRADISNPTRKFYAQVCPGFFAPASGSGPDPTSTYTAWTYGAITNGNPTGKIDPRRMVAATTAAPDSRPTISTTASANVGVNNIAVWKLANSGSLSTLGTNKPDSEKFGPLSVPQPTWTLPAATR